MVEASLAVRPVLRAFAPRTGVCFEALPVVDLAPRSDADPDRAGAVEAAWSEEAELNVDAEWVLFDKTGAGVPAGEAVATVPWAADGAAACVTGRTF